MKNFSGGGRYLIEAGRSEKVSGVGHLEVLVGWVLIACRLKCKSYLERSRHPGNRLSSLRGQKRCKAAKNDVNGQNQNQRRNPPKRPV